MIIYDPRKSKRTLCWGEKRWRGTSRVYFDQLFTHMNMRRLFNSKS